MIILKTGSKKIPLRLCSVCHELIDKRVWQAHRESHRGTRRQRGIGPNHEALAKRLRNQPRSFCCALCGRLGGQPDNPLTVGHIRPRASFSEPLDADDPSNLQPECRSCNLRKGAS